MKSRRLSDYKAEDSKRACYIFGDGPSIRYVDYGEFTDRPAICCGNQIFHRSYPLLNVKAYAIIEPWLFYPPWLLRLAGKKGLAYHWPLTKKYLQIFSNCKKHNFYVNSNNKLFTLNRNFNYLSSRFFYERPAFSALKEKSFNPMAGSFSACISLAITLGFEKILLVGFDAFTTRASALRWYFEGSEQTELVRPDQNLLQPPILSYFREHAEISVLQITPSAAETRYNIIYDPETWGESKMPLPRELDQMIQAENLDLLRDVYC